MPISCTWNKSFSKLDNVDVLVNIKVKSSTWGFNLRSRDFSLPIQVIFSREKEMQQRAQKLGILPNAWSESFIMRKVKDCLRKASIKRRIQKIRNQAESDWYSFNHELSVHLDIDEIAHPSDSCNWDPCLNDDIRRYYTTGEIAVTDRALENGYDVTFAFQCFGILYDHTKITFDTFATVLRSKKWNEYHACRENVSNWVMERIDFAESKFPSGQAMAFVTSPEIDCFDIYLLDGGFKCEILDMTSTTRDHRYDCKSPARID